MTLFSILVPVQDMNACRLLEAQIHSFLSYALDVNESPASRPSRFTSGTITPTYALNRTRDRSAYSLVTITTDLSRLLQLDDYED